MRLVSQKVDDIFLDKVNDFNFTPFIKEKIETGLTLYRDMKKFYEGRGNIIPDEHYICLLGDNNDLIIGYRYHFFNPETKRGKLFSIAVDPEYRRKGYAKQMIYEALKLLEIKGITKITIPLVKNEEPFYILEKFYSTCEYKYPQIKFNVQLSSGK